MELIKKLKKIVLILLVLLISLIGFVGVYVQNKNLINNILPEYKLGIELSGYRKVVLEPSTTTQHVHEEGEEHEEDEEVEQEEIVISKEQKKEIKKIIEKRIGKTGVEEYYIRQSEDGKNIVVYIPENDKTDSIVGQLQSAGKFEITDNETDEVLMTNEDIKNVKAGYGTTTTGTTSVFLNIQFNKEGTKKFKDITNTYIEVEENAEETENTNEAAEEVDEEQEETTKEIAIKVDDSTLLTTHFDEEISNGLLQLSIGSSYNSSTESLQEKYEQANNMAALLSSGKLPVNYEIKQNKYIKTDIEVENIKVIIILEIIIAILGIVFIILKNKKKGILSAISIIGYTAFLTIVLRYTNVIISISGMVAFILSVIIEYIFLYNISSKKVNNFWKEYLKYMWILIPIMIIGVVFTFKTYILVSSFGMVIFWGIVTKYIWNAIITKNILDMKK